MREIKFMAWDVKKKKFYYSDEIVCFKVDMGFWFTGAHSCHPDFFMGWGTKSELLPITQYTGLHDKNGKELWQGDIYTDPNWPRKPLVVEWVDDLYDDNGSNYYGWSVAFPKEGMDNSAYGPTKIGNIFENPERLEAT